MFRNGDLVKIKAQFQNKGETDQVYRVVNVNEATKRCYIELRDCELPLSPQELVSFDMLHLHRSAPIPVHFNGDNTLVDSYGVNYSFVPNSLLFMSQDTGEVFRVVQLDAAKAPLQIVSLHQHIEDINQLVDSICQKINTDSITKTARVSAIWDNSGIAVDLNYAYDEKDGYGDGELCFCETYSDGRPDILVWDEVNSIAKRLGEKFNLPVDVYSDKEIFTENARLKLGEQNVFVFPTDALTEKCKVKAVNIEWDCDSSEDLEFLPTEIEVPDGMLDEERISDFLSNVTGFCHKGFSLEISQGAPERNLSLSDKIQSAAARSTKSNHSNGMPVKEPIPER